MNNYVKHLERQYSKATFKRKIDYIDFNFGKVIENLDSKNSKVLEIGPGMGECVKYLNDKGFRDIDIIDNDEEVLEIVGNKFKVRAKYCVEDLTTLGSGLGKYDLIILVQVLEHIALDKQAGVVKMLYSFLNKWGTILVVVPNANNPLGMAERYGDLQHKNSFTQQSLMDLVSDAGIKNYEFKISGFEIPPYSIVNVIRIVLQKILHLFLYVIMIINGGVFFKVMTPNIVLSLGKRD